MGFTHKVKDFVTSFGSVFLSFLSEGESSFRKLDYPVMPSDEPINTTLDLTT